MEFASSSTSRFSKEEDEEEEQEPEEEEEEDEEASPREIPFMTAAAAASGTGGGAASSSSSPPAAATASASGSATLRSSDGAGASGSGGDDVEVIEKEHMFDKVVTPSDVGKLNRLVIPKQHAEKYFPLDAAANEKGLLLSFEDRAGKLWRFRYSYWNSSQSYVMTKGWSRFVKEKRLDAGDTVSFCRGAGDAARDRLFIDWKRRADSRDPHRMPRLPLPMAPVASPYGPWGGGAGGGLLPAPRAPRHTLRAPPLPPGPRLPQHQRRRAGQAAPLLRLRRHAPAGVHAAAAAASTYAQHYDGAAHPPGHVGSSAHGSRLRTARQQPDGGRQARAPVRSQPRQPATEHRRVKPRHERIIAEDAGMAEAEALEVPRIASTRRRRRYSWRRVLCSLVAVVVLLLQERSALVTGSRSVTGPRSIRPSRSIRSVQKES
jgi:hypothetical protein